MVPCIYGKGRELGDVVETNIDLVAKFGTEKFELLSAEGDGAPDGLEDLGITSLKTIAENEKVDTTGLRKKDDIIAAIRAARG